MRTKEFAVTEKAASRDLLNLLLLKLKGKSLCKGMKGIKKGAKPHTLTFVTEQGEVECRMTECEEFVYFNLPTGARLALRKSELDPTT